MVLWSESPEWAETTFAIARLLPSGAHAIGDDGGPGGKLTGMLHVPDVKRRASPPALATSQRWVGVGASVIVKSSFPTSNASLNFSRPVFFGDSSAVAYATVVPSGDQANCCTPLDAFVRRCGSPPFIGMTKICGF